MIKALIAEQIFTGFKTLYNHAILVEDGVIKEVVASAAIEGASYEKIYFRNKILTPGFIDLQVNGCGGVSFNQNISLETLYTMKNTWAKYGTSKFLPTLITADFADVMAALEVVKKWMDEYGKYNGVIGIHLEGPFISTQKPGIHPLQYIIPPTDKCLEQISAYAKYFPIKITIAPEVFLPKQIEYLIKEGIILAIGHSNATSEQINHAIDLGVTTATHLFNAMSGLSARAPGVIGAVLSKDNIYNGIIADMEHVALSNLDLTFKLKPQTTYLVTDAIAGVGSSIKSFEFANTKLFVKDGKCVDDSGRLGGAMLTMNDAVKNCVTNKLTTLEQALAMASLVPAKVMHLDNVMGRIECGRNADIIALDLDDFSCEQL